MRSCVKHAHIPDGGVIRDAEGVLKLFFIYVYINNSFAARS